MRQQIIDKVTKYMDKGFTISEIARQVGISQSMLWRMVYSDRVGSVGTLEKIEAWIPKIPKRKK